MQLVLLERLGAQWTEGVEADVQCDALCLEAGQQLRGEVKARRRRRGRAGLVGVDRLVARRVGERLGDVRRQRRLPRRLAFEAHEPATLAEVRDELDRAVPLPRSQLPRRPRERLPEAVFDGLQQEYFDVPACLPAQAKPGRDDPRVVDDGELAAQLRGQLRERALAHGAALALVHEQARGVAALHRVLGDQLGRERRSRGLDDFIRR